MTDGIDRLLEAAFVDDRCSTELLVALEHAFSTTVRFPLVAVLSGRRVELISIECDEERPGLIALLRDEGETQDVPLADIALGPSTVETAQLFEAYRRWLIGSPGVAVVGRALDVGQSWAYRPTASKQVLLSNPLALEPRGSWNPAEELWGGPVGEADPLISRIAAVVSRRRPASSHHSRQWPPGVTGG